MEEIVQQGYSSQYISEVGNQINDQYNKVQIVFSPTMLTLLFTGQTSYIDLKSFNLSPEIISPGFEHSQIHFNATLKSSETNNGYDDINHEIEQPEQSNISFHVKPAVGFKPQLLPSPFTTPPTPHTSSNTSNTPNIRIKSKKNTSINKDLDIKPVKQEKDGEDNLSNDVNPKQRERILKRRIARERIEKKYNFYKKRKSYTYESRHVHALRRPRGPGGRFLNAAEMAELAEQSSTSPTCVSPTISHYSTTFYSAPLTYINSTSPSCVSPTTPCDTPSFFPITYEPYSYEWETDLCKNNNQTYFTNECTGLSYEGNFSQSSPTHLYYNEVSTNYNLQCDTLFCNCNFEFFNPFS